MRVLAAQVMGDLLRRPAPFELRFDLSPQRSVARDRAGAWPPGGVDGALIGSIGAVRGPTAVALDLATDSADVAVQGASDGAQTVTANDARTNLLSFLHAKVVRCTVMPQHERRSPEVLVDRGERAGHARREFTVRNASARQANEFVKGVETQAEPVRCRRDQAIQGNLLRNPPMLRRIRQALP